MPDDSAQLLETYQPTETAFVSATPQIHAARFTPCGNYLVAGTFDSHVRRWNLQAEPAVDPATDPKKKKSKLPSFAEMATVTGHEGWVSALGFQAARKHVFSGDSWGKLACWNYSEDQPKPIWSHDQAHDGWLRELAVSPDGKIVASCGRDKAVRLWSTADGKKLREFPDHQEDVYSLKFLPDGKTLVSGDLKGVVKQWDVATGKVVREFDAGILYVYRRLQEVGGAHCLAVSADGKQLAVGGTQPKTSGNVTGIPTLLIFDMATGKQLHKMEFGATTQVYVHEAHFHPAGFMMVVTSGTPGVGQFVFQRPGDEKPFFENKKMSNCHSLSLHPDGKRLAVTATNRGSNGNGRRVDKEGKYIANSSPIHVFEFPTA